jgi:hypothetical protein
MLATKDLQYGLDLPLPADDHPLRIDTSGHIYAELIQ